MQSILSIFMHTVKHTAIIECNDIYSNLSVNIDSIQHYVIKFVSDLRQVCGFIRVLRFPPSIKMTTMI
jgi:hypothetical protein